MTARCALLSAKSARPCFVVLHDRVTLLNILLIEGDAELIEQVPRPIEHRHGSLVVLVVMTRGVWHRIGEGCR